MSAATSAATGRRYELRRVCQAWERSRSALYARRTHAQQRQAGAAPGRRGPTPALSEATLRDAIQADLARSPFQGEGRRQVHARLRVMRAYGLLSPHRGRPGNAQRCMTGRSSRRPPT